MRALRYHRPVTLMEIEADTEAELDAGVRSAAQWIAIIATGVFLGALAAAGVASAYVHWAAV